MQATNTTSIIAIRIIMQKNNFSLADIHTHILPGIDDGADSVEVAIELLYEEQKQGITDIVLTPHFNIQETTIQEFLLKREESFKLLLKEMEKQGYELVWYPKINYAEVTMPHATKGNMITVVLQLLNMLKNYSMRL